MTEIFRRSRYRRLMDEDDNFSSWIENIARGSKVNAEVTLRRAGRVCALFQVTQRDLARMSRGEAGAFLLKVVSRMEEGGTRSSSIASYVKTLKGWWRFNDLEVTRQVRLSRDVGLYDNERVPSRQELHSILEHADLQKNVCCALMAFSGVRPGVIGSRYSYDGLRVSDLPEMVVKTEDGRLQVSFLKVPTVVVVRRAISKTGRQYATFLPEQGCTYLKQYLEWRMETLKEKVDASSPIQPR